MTRTPNRRVTVGHTLWNARSGSRPVRSPGANTIVVLLTTGIAGGGICVAISSSVM